MTGKEIFEFAKKNIELPEDATLSEQLMYGIAVNICKAYRDGIIDEQQARAEKNKAIQTFGVQQLSEKVNAEYAKRWNETMIVLAEAERKCGCEYCKKIAKILDGRR